MPAYPQPSCRRDVYVSCQRLFWHFHFYDASFSSEGLFVSRLHFGAASFFMGGLFLSPLRV
jgi:hypothetical protein